MTLKEKIAVKTALNIAISPKTFGVVTKNTPSENDIVARTLESLFDFDENGAVIGFRTETVDSLYWLSKQKAKFNDGAITGVL